MEPVSNRRVALRALVVDDDEGMSAYVSETLRQEGFEVFLASTGEKGVGLFRNERISIVLLDICMGNKDGFETLMEIRRCSPEARVITMSGYREYRGLDVEQWSEKLGAIIVLPKPFTRDELINCVRDALSRGNTGFGVN